jgi:hypothetical protein
MIYHVGELGDIVVEFFRVLQGNIGGKVGDEGSCGVSRACLVEPVGGEGGLVNI